jgi:serine/threonine protein kinase
VPSLSPLADDLQPENIMLDEDLNAVIIDFDAARKAGTELGQDDKRAMRAWRDQNTMSTKETDLFSLARLKQYLVEGWRPT